MALIKCPNCGNQISDKAVKCPHCGKDFTLPNVEQTTPTQPQTVSKNTQKKWWLVPVISGIIAMLAVLWFLVGNKHEEKPQSTPRAVASAQPANDAKPPMVYSKSYDGFVNIRQDPQSNAPILGVLRNGPEGAILLGTEGEWKKIDCNGIIGYVYEKYVQDTPTEVIQYWRALRKDASIYHFTENDLNPLTARELTYLRNSVYAKHGYVFKSQELNNYFKQFSWYHPDSSVTEAALNSIEKTNVQFIKNYQEQNGKTYKPQ